MVLRHLLYFIVFVLGARMVGISTQLMFDYR